MYFIIHFVDNFCFLPFRFIYYTNFEYIKPHNLNDKIHVIIRSKWFFLQTTC